MLFVTVNSAPPCLLARFLVSRYLLSSANLFLILSHILTYATLKLFSRASKSSKPARLAPRIPPTRSLIFAEPFWETEVLGFYQGNCLLLTIAQPLDFLCRDRNAHVFNMLREVSPYQFKIYGALDHISNTQDYCTITNPSSMSVHLFDPVTIALFWELEKIGDFLSF